jgi:chromosome segregation ATPase
VDGEEHSEASANPAGDAREEASGSGWTTTKQAAKVLGVSRRSVQGYVRRGLLEAQEQGQGVKKTFLVSIDSLNALHDRRRHEASAAAKFAEASAEAAETANQYTDTGEALRHAIERVEARTAEATELRIRLELTEQAQSTLQEELAEERRRREEAEREREDLRQELAAVRESRESPQVVEEEQERAEEPRSATVEAQEGARRPWWRRMFGG